MIDEGPPMVPDVRGRNRRRPDGESEIDSEGIKEEMDALKMEAPFVPVIAKRRESRLRKTNVKLETDDD
ncbi:MAG: hypothetical protein SXQ77_09405 [Halobacteria archaeon]|nr:hypothetical protein [Halobacteria archaeon]